MNSDPYDSAAWRTFGMLDADESAIFDEAMRHDPVLRGAYLEMERLSAAIAVATVAPIAPKAGQLERLQRRLDLNRTKPAYLWLGISGWAAAAVLAVMLILDRTGILGTTRKASIASSGTPAVAGETAKEPAKTVPAGQPATDVPKPPGKRDDLAAGGTEATGKDQEGRTARVETKRLVQEIEVLRENLEKFQHRDRALFEAVPGMALPIVMKMTPPGVEPEDSLALAKNDGHSEITTLLGDALKVMNESSKGLDEEDPFSGLEAGSSLIAEHPTAIPIYDAARDAGTFVVSNLPPAEVGQVYNLWVTTGTGGQPIYVGSLPESSASGADSFDFSLGSNMVLPSGFLLTKDPFDSPATPSETNTVLQGPPTPDR